MTTLNSTLALLACAVWLANGFYLLANARPVRSRSDFRIGLGLLAGGLLIGVATGRNPGSPGYPVETLLLAVVLWWNIREAAIAEPAGSRFEPGDGWFPATLLTVIATNLYLLHEALPPAPTLTIAGLTLRPFECMPLMILVAAWRSPGVDVAGLRPPLLLAMLACLAGLLGGNSAAGLRWLALAAIPILRLLAERPATTIPLRRAAAAGLVCALGLAALAATQATGQTQETALAQLGAIDSVSRSHDRLTRPVDLAVRTWAAKEPQVVFENRRNDLESELHHLGQTMTPGPQVTNAVAQLGNAVTSQVHWGRQIFESIGLRTAAWGDAVAVRRLQDQARSAWQECELARERGAVALTELQAEAHRLLAASLQQTRGQGSMLAALLTAFGLLSFSMRRPHERDAPYPDSSPSTDGPPGVAHRPRGTVDPVVIASSTTTCGAPPLVTSR